MSENEEIKSLSNQGQSSKIIFGRMLQNEKSIQISPSEAVRMIPYYKGVVESLKNQIERMRQDHLIQIRTLQDETRKLNQTIFQLNLKLQDEAKKLNQAILQLNLQNQNETLQDSLVIRSNSQHQSETERLDYNDCSSISDSDQYLPSSAYKAKQKLHQKKKLINKFHPSQKARKNLKKKKSKINYQIQKTRKNGCKLILMQEADKDLHPNENGVKQRLLNEEIFRE